MATLTLTRIKQKTATRKIRISIKKYFKLKNFRALQGVWEMR